MNDIASLGKITAVLLAAAGLVSGCSKEPSAPDLVEITPRIALPPDMEAQTKAPADPTQNITFHMCRSDEQGDGSYSAYAVSDPPLTAVRTGGSGATALRFSTTQYYLESRTKKTRITGYYPAGTRSGVSADRALWNLTGSDDVMTAIQQEGCANTPMPALKFKHKLSQIRFAVYTQDAAIQSQWGKVTKIVLTGQPAQVQYLLSNAATGTIGIYGSTTTSYPVNNTTATTIPIGTAAAVYFGDPVMIFPQTGYVLSLEVTTEKGGTVTVDVPANTYSEGTSLRLLLRFTPREISVEPDATVSDWVPVAPSEVTSDPVDPEKPSLPPPGTDIGDWVPVPPSEGDADPVDPEKPTATPPNIDIGNWGGNNDKDVIY